MSSLNSHLPEDAGPVETDKRFVVCLMVGGMLSHWTMRSLLTVVCNGWVARKVEEWSGVHGKEWLNIGGVVGW